jgi:hypothetical protein
MKVFVPMSDESLGDNSELYRKLVPFSPEYLERRPVKGHKPSNWVSDCNYERAVKRLSASRV